MLFLSAVPATERALKKNFDGDGKQKGRQFSHETAKRAKNSRSIRGINLTEKKEKEARLVKITGWIMICLDILAIVSLNKTLLFACPVFVLLTAWGMYIWMYPASFLDLSQTVKIRKREIGISAFGIGFAGMICMALYDEVNFPFRNFMAFVGIFMIMSLIPIILKYYKLREIPEKSSIMGTVLISFFLAFLIVFPVNYLISFQDSVHESIVVNEKDYSVNRFSTKYYIHADWQEDNQQFSVSRSLYEDAREGDRLQVCLRRSILGFPYWAVHN